jgi:hypothetical protein
MKMEPDTIYKPSEIIVNAEDLRRLRELLDQRLADDLDIYRRLENLIKQGSVPLFPGKKQNENQS